HANNALDGLVVEIVLAACFPNRAINRWQIAHVDLLNVFLGELYPVWLQPNHISAVIRKRHGGNVPIARRAVWHVDRHAIGHEARSFVREWAIKNTQPNAGGKATRWNEIGDGLFNHSHLAARKAVANQRV